jgi:hypothetical protein
MGQVTPAKKKRDSGHHAGDRKILVGDIVVTAVAGQYAIGQMTADGATQESLGSQPKLAEALEQACALARAKYRVFLYPSTGTPHYVRFVCPKCSK